MNRNKSVLYMMKSWLSGTYRFMQAHWGGGGKSSLLRCMGT